MNMLAALKRRYDWLAARGGVPLRGFSMENVHFTILISEKGEFVELRDERRLDKRGKPLPVQMNVPQPPSDRRGLKIVPDLFWGPVGYAIGYVKTNLKWGPDRIAYEQRRAIIKFDAFRQYNLAVLGARPERDLVAFCEFLRTWIPSKIHGDRYERFLSGAHVVFAVDRPGAWPIHTSDAAKEIINNRLEASSNPDGICLVTGNRAKIERLHPPIAGFPDADKIVSFNEPAFESFGKKQGANAPVSEEVAYAYTAALSQLLRSHCRVQIGNVTMVFWVDLAADANKVDSTAAEKFELLAAEVISGEASSEIDETAENTKLFDALATLAMGRPEMALGHEIDRNARFYVLGLSPNAARIAVRFFLDTTIQQFAVRLKQHYEDLMLDSRWWRWKAPSIRRLVTELSPIRVDRNGHRSIVFEKIPEHLIDEFTRAVLWGSPYPYAALATVLGRVKSDGVVTGLRVAIVKAILIRRERILLQRSNLRTEEIESVSMAPPTGGVGRKLGCLFALYERAQEACFKKLNSSLTDKFFASASSTPGYVFPSLDKNFRNHLSKLKKGNELADWVKNGPGMANVLERSVGELTAELDAYPAQLALEEQGQFIIGYYQEKYGPKVSRDNIEDPPEKNAEEKASET